MPSDEPICVHQETPLCVVQTETLMRCDECGEPAELICLDCETPFCPEHLHALGAHWASVVCAKCMDVEMAGAS